MDLIAGVYKITNLIDGKFYIGGSKHIRKRLSEHKTLLKRNEHFNPHLQRAWNRYGMKNFKFEVIILCEEGECFKREQEQLDLWWDTGYLYNMSNEANFHSGSCKSVVCWDKNKKLIEVFKSLSDGSDRYGVSASQIANVCNGRERIAGGVFWSWFGDEPIIRDPIKLRCKNMKKVSCFDLNKNLLKIYNSMADASRDTGIKLDCISNACRGKSLNQGVYLWAYYGCFPIVRQKRKTRVGEKPICCYNKDKIFIKEYRSTIDASDKTGIPKYTIYKACKNRMLSMQELFWRYSSDNHDFKDRIDRRKKVLMYNDGFKKGFDSVTMASKETGVSMASISLACKNKRISMGYYWKFI